MKAIEIIHLRLAGNGPENLVDIIRDSVGSVPALADVRIYRHSKLRNDLAIHLHRETAGANSGFSDVGIRLASLLRDHGMVEHSVWAECCGLAEGTEPDGTGFVEKEG